MYTVDSMDSVKQLDSLPQSSIGAPLPVLLSDESSTLLAYLIEERDADWDGKTCRVVGPETGGEPIAIVRFLGRADLRFGRPNDEAFAGHPLASRGLEPCGSFEVLRSSWIRQLEQMNRVHNRHRAESYWTLRHFVLSFHDSTFECVAQDVRAVETMRGSMRQALARMTALLSEKAERSPEIVQPCWLEYQQGLKPRVEKGAKGFWRRWVGGGRSG